MENSDKADTVSETKGTELVAASSGKEETPPTEQVDAEVIDPEILKSMSPRLRHVVEEHFMGFASGPMPNPITKHVKPEHITQALQLAENNAVRNSDGHDREVRDRKHARVCAICFIVAVVILVGVIWGLLPADRITGYKDLLMQIVMLAAAAFGGWGYANSRKRDD
jgi:hypothetical protein